MTKHTIRGATSQDSVHPRSMARVLIYPSLDSLVAVEGTANHLRLIKLRGCTG